VTRDILFHTSPSRIWRDSEAEVVRDLTASSIEKLETRVKEITGFDLAEQML
jgi:hypothetical protein